MFQITQQHIWILHATVGYVIWKKGIAASGSYSYDGKDSIVGNISSQCSV